MVFRHLFAFIFSILIFGVAAHAEETKHITFPKDSTLSNESKIKVNGKKIKQGRNSVKLNKSDNISLTDHLERSNWVPSPSGQSFPSTGMAHAVFGFQEPGDAKRLSERDRSRRIINQIIIPYLQSKSLGDPNQLLKKYREHQAKAKSMMGEQPLVDTLETDDAHSLILGLNRQLENFESASRSFQVCEPLIGARRVEVSASQGIIPHGELVPSKEKFPGAKEEDYVKVIRTQREIFSTSEDSRTRFTLNGPELRSIHDTLEKYKEFGQQAQAHAAAWTLRLGAFDGKIIELASGLLEDPSEVQNFYTLLESEARIVRLGYLYQAKLHKFENADIQELLDRVYKERTDGLTQTNLLIEARAAAQKGHSLALADLISAYNSRKNEIPENRVYYFQLGLEHLQAHPNLQLFEALISLAVSSDERISLFETIQRLRSSDQPKALQLSLQKLQNDLSINQSKQKEIIDREFSPSSLTDSERRWVQLNTENPTAALILLSLTRRQIQGKRDFALNSERAEVLRQLQSEHESQRRSLEPQIRWLRDSITNGGLDFQARLHQTSELAKLQLQVTGDWASAIDIFEPVINSASNEIEVSSAIKSLTDLFPNVIDFAYRDQLRREHLQTAFNEFQVFYYDPYIERLLEEGEPTQEQISVVKLNRELRADLQLSANQLSELRKAIEERITKLLEAWENIPERQVDEVFSAFNKAYTGESS